MCEMICRVTNGGINLSLIQLSFRTRCFRLKQLITSSREQLELFGRFVCCLGDVAGHERISLTCSVLYLLCKAKKNRP